MNNFTPELIFHIVEILIAVGFYYGVVKIKLEALEKIAYELNQFRHESLFANGANQERDESTHDKLDKIEDRLDVHDEAIRSIEIIIARMGD